MLTAAQIARTLTWFGYEVSNISEPNREEDGNISISQLIHVQVGYDYAGVIRKLNDGKIEFFPQANGIPGLVMDLQKALTNV